MKGNRRLQRTVLIVGVHHAEYFFINFGKVKQSWFLKSIDDLDKIPKSIKTLPLTIYIDFPCANYEKITLPPLTFWEQRQALRNRHELKNKNFLSVGVRLISPHGFKINKTSKNRVFSLFTIPFSKILAPWIHKLIQQHFNIKAITPFAYEIGGLIAEWALRSLGPCVYWLSQSKEGMIRHTFLYHKTVIFVRYMPPQNNLLYELKTALQFIQRDYGITLGDITLLFTLDTPIHLDFQGSKIRHVFWNQEDLQKSSKYRGSLKEISFDDFLKRLSLEKTLSSFCWLRLKDFYPSIIFLKDYYRKYFFLKLGQLIIGGTFFILTGILLKEMYAVYNLQNHHGNLLQQLRELSGSLDNITLQEFHKFHFLSQYKVHPIEMVSKLQQGYADFPLANKLSWEGNGERPSSLRLFFQKFTEENGAREEVDLILDRLKELFNQEKVEYALLDKMTCHFNIKALK